MSAPRFMLISRRLLSSSSKSWERSATLVKNTDKSSNYLDHIRQTHDPALHVKTLEEEIRGTMGAALGKQSKKILSSLRLMEQEREEYDELVNGDDGKKTYALNSSLVIDCAKRHNEYRQEAVTARWELLVHRQAVGFLVDNHKIVHEHFPIGEKLPVHDGIEVIVEKKEVDQQQTNHRGQLDWWQTVGRWR